MYDCIEKCYPDCLQEFVLKCNSLKMGAYIDEHIKNKSNDKI
jgi:hypothetical protein